MKKTKSSLCHDCLKPFDATELLIVPLAGSGVPYSAGMCAPCVKSRKVSAKGLETLRDQAKRLNKYLGLN
jgi:hypothetical protein